MPRIARVVVPGLPHHVTQRGNRRGTVFFGDADRLEYLALLSEYTSRHADALKGSVPLDASDSYLHSH